MLRSGNTEVLRCLVSLALFVLAVAAPPSAAGSPGFRSKEQLDSHYRKHGREFGNITKEQYLRLAQQLRDAPPGAGLLQHTRKDGVVTKFDRRKGHFGAYNPDGTIRTFFIPVDGERYFRRQANRGGP